jgi:hypothetical protein
MARNCPGTDEVILVEDDQLSIAKDIDQSHKNQFGYRNY